MTKDLYTEFCNRGHFRHTDLGTCGRGEREVVLTLSQNVFVNWRFMNSFVNRRLIKGQFVGVPFLAPLNVLFGPSWALAG